MKMLSRSCGNAIPVVQSIRRISMRKVLLYCKFGQPGEVLELCEMAMPCAKENEIRVRVLAAPINPADINTIQGRYPVKPKFPAIGGNEFVGEVEWTGRYVRNISVGDRVIPRATGIGTWTSHGIYTENQLMKLEHKIGMVEAATITVNPCTAYRMLKDFVKLKKGDTVIQNGANSAVGQAVHQLCKAWGIKSLGVVRDRNNLEALVRHLSCIGASKVLTDTDILKTNIFKKKKLKKPKLGFNCVGGKSATSIARHLDNGGYLVTYGGMSMQPIIANTASLIFKDLHYVGFWVTRWTNRNLESSKRKKMIDDLCCLMVDKKLRAPPHELVAVSDYKDAVESILGKGSKAKKGKKLIFNFAEC